MRYLPGYALRRAATAMSAEIAERFATVGLRMSEASILMLIAANAGISAAQIGRALGIKRANMTPLIAGLEAQGWISREARDGRSMGLALTKTGIHKAAEASRISDEHEANLLSRVPAAHRDHLLPALQALSATE